MLNNRSEPLHFSCKYLRESLPVNGQRAGAEIIRGEIWRELHNLEVVRSLQMQALCLSSGMSSSALRS